VPSGGSQQTFQNIPPSSSGSKSKARNSYEATYQCCHLALQYILITESDEGAELRFAFRELKISYSPFPFVFGSFVCPLFFYPSLHFTAIINIIIIPP
jgi:hypothetical protein